MPLPFQLDHINLWLVEDGEGWTVVDTGIGNADTRALWEKIFSRFQNVKRVILTHYHPDHAGNAAWICKRFGAEMWTTQGEYLTAHAVRASGAGYTSEAVLDVFRKNGLPADRVESMTAMRGNNRYSALVPEFPFSYRRIIEGDRVKIGAHDWKAMIGHGHAPEHLSLYLLDIHEGTPLADQIRRGMHPTPDDDLAAEMYSRMVDRVRKAGYEHYEISNFCLSGLESRHNTKYWTGAPYYGFGCSAHSYDGRFRRWSNERDVARYTESLESNRSAIVEGTVLSDADARAESMFLGLRMMRGLDARSFADRFGADPREEYKDDLARFCEAGLIEVDGELIRLTPNGALFSNEVFAAFV